jgi:chaperonin GroEL (HSP60 family)
MHFLALMSIIVSNAEKFKSDLMKIAMTTLSSKILSQDKEYFAKLAVDAVMRLKVKWFILYLTSDFFLLFS